MAVSQLGQEFEASSHDLCAGFESCTIGELSHADDIEVLDFLAARPIHTVYLVSMIRDNGLVSPHNRGSFYASRDGRGQLEGVALLGHATLIEARTESALSVFARLARNCQNAHLIRGEQDTINSFWKYYANSGQEPRLICRERLLEMREPAASAEAVTDLRLATPADLDKVLAVNASMAFEEGGISPLQKDPSGFRNRNARRIEQGRVWVWFQDGRLIFKADVVAETPEVTYLEGIHVHAEERRKGYGLRCLAQLSSILLARSQSLCLTVNEHNHKATAFNEKAGYHFHSHYETIYLR